MMREYGQALLAFDNRITRAGNRRVVTKAEGPAQQRLRDMHTWY